MALVNGDFEAWSAGSPTSWTKSAPGGSTVTQESTIIHGGASSAKFSIDAVPNTASLTQNATCTPGLTHALSIWTRMSVAASFALRITIVGGASAGFWLQNDGSWLVGGNQFAFVPGLSGNAGAFTQWTLTSAAVPSGATAISFQILAGDANAVGYVDDAVCDAIGGGASAGRMGLLGVGSS